MKLGSGLATVLAGALACGSAFAQTPPAPDLSGTWQATAMLNGTAIPFRLKLAEHAGVVQANFFDGARPTNPSTPARLDGDKLRLAFPSYAAALDLTVSGAQLEGNYLRNHTAIPVSAVRSVSPPSAAESAPSIAGEWIIPGVTAKGEKAWRLIVHQRGARAEATILRVDGDTGTLDGRFQDGAFHLSHFAGERPAVLEIRPQADHRLALSLTDGDGHADLTALRPAEAQAQGVAPADPTHFTGVADASAPFRFDFPDLQGRRFANTDRRFRGKVLVVDVMGSWCPNCHDETPFLEALYRKHHAQGLEVVALDFEQPDQLADPQRLRAFVARYGVTYTVLLAGAVQEVHDKLPQATNLSAWPTTFFVGRDGRVKAVHVGFTSPGSGARDLQTKADVEKQVQALLAQKTS